MTIDDLIDRLKKYSSEGYGSNRVVVSTADRYSDGVDDLSEFLFGFVELNVYRGKSHDFTYSKIGENVVPAIYLA